MTRRRGGAAGGVVWKRVANRSAVGKVGRGAEPVAALKSYTKTLRAVPSANREHVPDFPGLNKGTEWRTSERCPIIC